MYYSRRTLHTSGPMRELTLAEQIPPHICGVTLVQFQSLAARPGGWEISRVMHGYVFCISCIPSLTFLALTPSVGIQDIT